MPCRKVLFTTLVTTFFTFSLTTTAQTLSPYNQQLGDKWMNSIEQVPHILQDRLEGEETLYSGNMVPEKFAKKILEADQKKVTAKISTLFNPKIYSSLQRQMKSTRLVELIKKGKLEPNSYQVGNNDEEVSQIGVYLELHLVKKPKPFKWGDVELHFDPSLLDRTDYLINPRWNFGLYGPLTATPLLNPGRVAYYVESFLQYGDNNEVVFFNEVPFSAVTKIVVVAGKRSELLKQIQVQALSCPQAGGCEAIIVE